MNSAGGQRHPVSKHARQHLRQLTLLLLGITCLVASGLISARLAQANVTLSGSVTAQSVANGIDIRWTTATETNSQLFHLLRSTSEQGPFQPVPICVRDNMDGNVIVNGVFAQGDIAGFSYAVTDLAIDISPSNQRVDDLVDGRTYYYLLVEKEATGYVTYPDNIAVVTYSRSGGGATPSTQPCPNVATLPGVASVLLPTATASVTTTLTATATVTTTVTTTATLTTTATPSVTPSLTPTATVTITPTTTITPTATPSWTPSMTPSFHAILHPDFGLLSRPGHSHPHPDVCLSLGNAHPWLVSGQWGAHPHRNPLWRGSADPGCDGNASARRGGHPHPHARSRNAHRDAHGNPRGRANPHPDPRAADRHHRG